MSRAPTSRACARDKLTGTIQNDILKEYVARGTWIFPVRPSMRLIADSILYANATTPRFNPISIAGAHVRDAGATAVEEMAYTLANGLAYVDELIARGGDVEKFAKRLSFFFYVHMDFFEEVCKFRAARRLWARLLRERYGVSDAKALHFRFGVVCGGSSLTAAQPYNNVIRVAVETMAAVMGGAQSIFTAAFDEALQMPTEFSAELALRTQQIIAYESGIANTVDPLGGSHLVEFLTDQMEREMERVMGEIDAYGGVVRAIEEGWLQARIAERALERKRDIDSQTHDRGGGKRIPAAATAEPMGARCRASIRPPPRTLSRSSSPYASGVTRPRWTERSPGCRRRPPTIGKICCPTWSIAATPMLLSVRWSRG